MKHHSAPNAMAKSISRQTPMENELLSCAECGTELEIMRLDPIELGLAPEVEEDWGE